MLNKRVGFSAFARADLRFPLNNYVISRSEMRKDCLPFALLGAEPFTGFNGLWGHLLEMWETAGRMSGSGGRTKASGRAPAQGERPPRHSSGPHGPLQAMECVGPGRADSSAMSAGFHFKTECDVTANTKSSLP